MHICITAKVTVIIIQCHTSLYCYDRIIVYIPSGNVGEGISSCRFVASVMAKQN